MKRTLGAILLIGLASTTPAADLRQSLDIQVPILPRSVQSGGKSVMAFEIHATNFTGEPLTLQALRILHANGTRTFAHYAGQALADRLRVVGAPGAPSGTLLPSGRRAVVYVELNMAEHGAPRALRLRIDGLDREGAPFTVDVPAARVDDTPPIELAPPMGSGTWVAVHDPSWDRGHRRVMYTLGGGARIPGRYAIDWVGVDPRGRISNGDPDRAAAAVGYGAAVFAGADAVVADIRDDATEASSIARSPAQPLGRGSGNYVVLRLSPVRYAFYEHLQPGSVSVRKGDRVHAGQQIGAVGFTGDTTGPHLHLHVADCASPLECEGVPFTINRMTELGTYASTSDLGVRRWDARRARGRIPPEWPTYQAVVDFAPPR